MNNKDMEALEFFCRRVEVVDDSGGSPMPASPIEMGELVAAVYVLAKDRIGTVKGVKKLVKNMKLAGSM